MSTENFLTVILPGLTQSHPELDIDVTESLLGNEDALTLKLLRVKDPNRRGNGLGTDFMRDFTACCDEAGLSIELEVIENDPENQARLENYYSRFDFVADDEGIMFRFPSLTYEPVL